jgi:hypothetical protein
VWHAPPTAAGRTVPRARARSGPLWRGSAPRPAAVPISKDLLHPEKQPLEFMQARLAEIAVPTLTDGQAEELGTIRTDRVEDTCLEVKHVA